MQFDWRRGTLSLARCIDIDTLVWSFVRDGEIIYGECLITEKRNPVEFLYTVVQSETFTHEWKIFKMSAREVISRYPKHQLHVLWIILFPWTLHEPKRDRLANEINEIKNRRRRVKWITTPWTGRNETNKVKGALFSARKKTLITRIRIRIQA